MEPLDIPGVWTFTPAIMSDDRGHFLELFQGGAFEEHVGYPLSVAQVNCSVSRRGALRGIHFCEVPPGQAKYVFCARGAVFDAVVDVRVGSPSFGRWTSVRLDDVERRVLYLAEGLGHAFMALSDEATVVYLQSAPYMPEAEHGVDPFDPEIGIDWPLRRPMLSPKDSKAPSLGEARRRGILPHYDVCREPTLANRTAG